MILVVPSLFQAFLSLLSFYPPFLCSFPFLHPHSIFSLVFLLLLFFTNFLITLASCVNSQLPNIGITIPKILSNSTAICSNPSLLAEALTVKFCPRENHCKQGILTLLPALFSQQNSTQRNGSLLTDSAIVTHPLILTLMQKESTN